MFCMFDMIVNMFPCLLVQVKSKLKGHSKRITGLAFSNVLNVLISSGADAQVLTLKSHSLMLTTSEMIKRFD